MKELYKTIRQDEDLALRRLLDSSEDTTDYLLSSPENARRLQESIDEIEAGKGLRRELIDP